MEELWSQIEELLALDQGSDSLDGVAMGLRAVIVYVTTLAIVRAGNKRFNGKSTAFDVVLGIMLGSIMSRAVTGSTEFLPTIFAGAVFVALHSLFSVLAYRTDFFGSVVKGNPVLLVKDGELREEGMERTSLTMNDIDQAQRLQGREPDIASIRLAHLERSGDISLIPVQPQPRIVEVKVEQGVQLVRIELT